MAKKHEFSNVKDDVVYTDYLYIIVTKMNGEVLWEDDIVDIYTKI